MNNKADHVHVMYVARYAIMVAVKKHHPTCSEVKRAAFAETYIATHDAKAARAASGLRSKNSKSRVLKKLEEDHCLADKARPGRPVTITQHALERAWQLLQSQESPHLTSDDLLHLLKQEELIPATSKRSTLLTHLRSYVKSLGHQLIPNFRGTIFALLKSDAPARVLFATELQEYIDQFGLDHIWFEDETTIEEFPHPKGMCHRVRGARLLCANLFIYSSNSKKQACCAIQRR